MKSQSWMSAIYKQSMKYPLIVILLLPILINNLAAGQNTFYGTGALQNNTSGVYNSAFGFKALYANDAGAYNSAYGTSALYTNTTGIFNTATGYNALSFNMSGSYNSATGFDALFANVTGNFNTADGRYSLLFNTSGSNNTAIGNAALYSNITGSHNTAIGDSAGYQNAGGSRNIFIGTGAGYYETSSNKFYIGNDSDKTIIYGDLATGQLLLGMGQPKGFSFSGARTLNVLGGILTDSIRIALRTQWADHVFAKGHHLRPLDELAKYIKANGHLPGIPTASEVAANGIDLAGISTRLLEKVEELHLYVLQQQDQLKAQQTQIDELKNLVIQLSAKLNR